MMTRGRLRAIESTRTRSNSLELAHKHMDELIAEVLRLRGALVLIGADGPHTAQDLRSMAVAALTEPDRGPPSFICRRGTLVDYPKEKP